MLGTLLRFARLLKLQYHSRESDRPVASLRNAAVGLALQMGLLPMAPFLDISAVQLMCWDKEVASSGASRIGGIELAGDGTISSGRVPLQQRDSPCGSGLRLSWCCWFAMRVGLCISELGLVGDRPDRQPGH